MSSPRSVPVPALGAFLAPSTALPFLLAVGYRLDRASLVLWLSLAALGAGVVVAWSRGVRLAPVVAAVAVVLLAFDPAFGGGPPAGLSQFSADALFLAVGHPLLAGGEWVARNRAAVRESVTTRDVRAGFAGAVVLVGVLAAVRWALGLTWPRSDPVFTAVATGWIVGGAALLGATAALAWTRRRLVTPALLVVGGHSIAVVDAVRFASSPAAGVGPTLLTLVSVGWFVPLTAVLAVGLAESRLRRRLANADAPAV